ncbi:MAG: TetR/AcrR family transcriptional regulator, partial [Mycobacterium sp.]
RNGIEEADARLMAHAAFGLLNSTPHSLSADGAKGVAASGSRVVLRAMTVAALSGGHREGVC